MANTSTGGLWMSQPMAQSTPSHTPKAIQLQETTQTPSKRQSQQGELTLALKSIIGTTTYSSRGFDCNFANSSFATCAGSAAVVTHVDSELKVVQKFFRSREGSSVPHSASSNHDSKAAASTPEPRTHLVGSLRRKTFGIGATRSPQVDQGVSPGRANIRQKTRATSCVSLSPDGRLLAVGETGYNPRILIYSTTNDVADPLACLSEHTFGVRCLAFSQDSRWLCSVGDPHDGFVYLWTVSQKTGSLRLHSSNKCISSVEDIAWMGNSVISVGTRTVKLWRLNQSAPASPSKTRFKLENAEPMFPSSPGPRTLPGRNCLLGPLLEATFTCVRPLSDSRAVLCTDRGSICLLDDSERMQRLYQVSSVDFSIRCITIDHSTDQLWVSGRGTDIHSMNIDELTQLETTSRKDRSASNSSSSTTSTAEDTLGLVALGSLSNCLVAIDSTRSIRLYKNEGHVTGWSVHHNGRQIHGHRSAVVGVSVMPTQETKDPGFFTWSIDGAVSLWTLEGVRRTAFEIPLDQVPSSDDEEPNELTIVRASYDGSFYVAGDKSGVIRYVQKRDIKKSLIWIRLLADNLGNESLPIKAHMGQINDIAVELHPLPIALVASCGRDRTLQIFAKKASNLELLQTIDHHASSVNEVRFFNDGATLLSLSSDRTITLHALATTDNSIAYIPIRIITLKSTPISVTTEWEKSMILVVSTIDKLVHKFEMSSGKQIHSMRVTDNENNESVLLNHLMTKTLDSSEPALQVLLGSSSADKSIRIHDSTSGNTIIKEYGHSEGISGLALISRRDESTGSIHTLISTGLDGTIMLWDILYSNSPPVDEPTLSTSLKDTPTIIKPLRKVVSRSALAEYHKSLEANGISPLPLPSGRSQSPSRLRKKPSRYSLAAPSLASPIPRLAPDLNSTRTMLQTPPLPITPTNDRQRPLFNERNRTKSANNISNLNNLNDLNKAAEQLYKSLVAFQSKMSVVSEHLNANMAADLESELEATKAAIRSQQREIHPKYEKTSLGSLRDRSRRGQAASESAVERLISVYSDRLARMVEEGVKAELSGQSLQEDERDRSSAVAHEAMDDVVAVEENEAVAKAEEGMAAMELEGKG
ncbi:hypothetical protein MMC26_007620 [Xylographa opegraphella]|nr:hypothetical protein [Xylographa opegraphella]